MTRDTRVFVAVMACTAAAACADSPPEPGVEVRIDTLPSGVVHVRNEPAEPDRVPDGWDPREIYRRGEEPVIFGRVEAVEIDPDGYAYAIDPSANIVRVFDPSGEHVRDLGGPGEGPGDFLSPDGLVVRDGRLWVRDGRPNLRYTVFERDGSRIAIHPRLAGGGGDPVVGDDGRIYESVLTIVDPMTRSYERSLRAVTLRDGVMQPVDTIPLPDDPQAFWMVDFAPTSGSGGVVVRQGGPYPIPFSPERASRVDPRGGFWTGTTDALRFVHMTAFGDTTRIVERAVRPRPLPEPERARTLSELRGRFGDRIAIDESELPESLPVWSSFFVDPDGRLWVERYAPEGEASPGELRRWEIYDPDGVFMGAVELPIVGDPTPAVRTGRLAGVHRDRLDVDHLVVYELERPGG